MKLVSKIEKIVSNFYFAKRSKIKTTSELDKRIMDDALPAYAQSLKTQSASIQPNIRRIIMQSKIVKLTAAAIILLAVILGINLFTGTSIDGASTAFAAAVDSIKQARTFSCIMIAEVNYESKQEKGKYLGKSKIMFKEPYWERREKLTSHWPQEVGEISIKDYNRRQQLVVKPVEKTAILIDLSSSYRVDSGTGELKLKMLDTSLRDYLLEKSMGTFEDLGKIEINGQVVWKLQSKKKNSLCTIWINPETNYPVQLELGTAEPNHPKVLYTEIQIDTELDNELFSLVSPEGYEFINLGKGGWSDYQSKLSAKIASLGLLCVLYHDKHQNQFPDSLSDIVASGIITDETLKAMLTPPDNTEGYPIFKYNKPEKDSDWRTTIILYEAYNQWPAEGIVVFCADGHSEIIKDQNEFVNRLK